MRQMFYRYGKGTETTHFGHDGQTNAVPVRGAVGWNILARGWIRRGRRFGKDRRGVLLVEYALIAAVTGMVAIAAIVSLGTAATTPLHRVQTALQSALHGGSGGGPICHPPGAGGGP